MEIATYLLIGIALIAVVLLVIALRARRRQPVELL